MQDSSTGGKRAMNRLHVAFAVVTAGVGLAIAKLGMSAPLLALGLVGLAIVGTAPRRMLPSIGLVAFALVPVKYLPYPGEPGFINPGLVIVTIWGLRTLLQDRRQSDRRRLGLAALLMGWLLLGTLLSGHLSTSVEWVASFAVLGVLPVFLMEGDTHGAHLLQTTWAALGAVLGLFALIETFVLRANPIYGWAYARADQPIRQAAFSVYRATTTLGYPLTNALFFSVALPLAFQRWQTTRRFVYALATALALGGVIATASRGGIAAAVAGVTVVLLVSPAQRVRRTNVMTRLAAAMAIFMIVLAASFGYLVERNDSQEGAASIAYRHQTLRTGLQLVKSSPIIGRGPGTADQTKRAASQGATRKLGLENSWIQLVVSLGVPGLLLFVLFCGSIAAEAIRARRNAAIGALTSYVVMAASFNLIEAHLPGLLLLGFVLALCATRAPSGEAVHLLVEDETKGTSLQTVGATR